MVKHLKGIRQLLVIYPYVVAGGFTVAKKGADGKVDAFLGFPPEPQENILYFIEKNAPLLEPYVEMCRARVITFGEDEGAVGGRVAGEDGLFLRPDGLGLGGQVVHLPADGPQLVGPVVDAGDVETEAVLPPTTRG